MENRIGHTYLVPVFARTEAAGAFLANCGPITMLLTRKGRGVFEETLVRLKSTDAYEKHRGRVGV